MAKSEVVCRPCNCFAALLISSYAGCLRMRNERQCGAHAKGQQYVSSGVWHKVDEARWGDSNPREAPARPLLQNPTVADRGHARASSRTEVLRRPKREIETDDCEVRKALQKLDAGVARSS
ncbi:unnamed protein product, partial [Polarella glacialis]